MNFEIIHPLRVAGKINRKPEKEGYLYRAFISSWQSYEGGRIETHIEFDELKIVARTPCGVWVAHPRSFYPSEMDAETLKAAKWKWVSLQARKAYAYKTQEMAMQSLLLRKYRHIAILEDKVASFKTGIKMLEKELGLDKPKEKK